MNTTDIEREANKLIADKIERGEPVEMRWAVNELIANGGDINGEGVEFYRICAREHCYDVVKQAVRKNDTESKTMSGSQPLLDGFACLMAAYSVQRNGRTQLVPIDSITDDELLDRADEFEKQSKGLKRHAQELRDYVSARNARWRAAIGAAVRTAEAVTT